MSFLRSTTSFTQFYVSADIPNSFWAEFPEKLRQYTFRDIDESSEEHSHGWVSFEDMLDVDWATPYQIGEYIVFALRIDTRRLSPAIFKKYYTLKLREEEKANVLQGRKYIGKDRKQELRELVRLQLFTRILPVPAHFQVVWSLKKNKIYFASVQGKVLELFSEYFTRSFGLDITQCTPLHCAYALLPESQHSLIDILETTEFSI